MVGNGACVHAPPPPNPDNHARAMAAELGRMGFDVQLEIGLDEAGMGDAFRRFGREVDGARCDP